MKKENIILVTGAAGFIGFHLCYVLLKKGFKVVGIDNLNSYYDVKLKLSRLEKIQNYDKEQWSFFKGNLEDLNFLNDIFDKFDIKIVINLAAQAGVRYSLKNPHKYINSNIVGFTNILECCRKYSILNLIYASSSSVYGGNKQYPFSEKDSVDHPVSLYAATKKSNELLAHTYSHLYKIPTTGLRLFTVYGPWGRPDMAPMLFAKAIINEEPIKIFNNGLMIRDFTYIDDVIEIIIKLIDKPSKPDANFDFNNPDPSTSWAPSKIFNIGRGNPLNLMDFISLLEENLGKKAIKEFLPIQPGDVEKTAANTNEIIKYINYIPKINVKDGIEKFVLWYKSFYKYR